MRSLPFAVRPLAVALAALVAVPPAFTRTLRCESRDYRYTFCPVSTHGDVTLRFEKSRSACHFGRSWGYDHRGIWVDRGCRADFAVDEGHPGRYSGYDYYDRNSRDYRYDRTHDTGAKVGAAAGGVLLGAAVAAAIIASKHKAQADDRDTTPSWLVGRFEGYNTQYRADVAIQVSPSGAATAFLPEGQKAYGTYLNGRIVFSGEEFDVEKTGSGFSLTQRSDRSNVVVYHRDR